MASTAISGTAFGAALAYSGVWRPDVIYQQFYLQDLSMLQVFVSASAASALAVLVTDVAKIAKVKARPTSTIGIFPYDANILGGSLVGLGMALSGACPGTVLLQVANGISSGYYAFVGCLLGASIYAGVADAYQWRFGKPIIQTSPGKTVSSSPSSHSSMLLGYATACAGGAFLLHKAGYSQLLQDVALSGGLAIGAAQLLSLLLRKSTVGISSGYGAIGDYVWSSISRRQTSMNWQPIIFNIGVTAGSYLILHHGNRTPISHVVTPLRALVGGMSMAMGARIAGGCTSGHGISGMATLGISSFVTVAAMFGAGIASATLLA